MLNYTSTNCTLEEMDKFLEAWNLPRLNYEEIENLNGPVMSKETESVIKTSQQRKAEDQMVSLVSSTNSYRRVNANFLHTLPKTWRERTLPSSFYKACITLHDQSQKRAMQENYHPIFSTKY